MSETMKNQLFELLELQGVTVDMMFNAIDNADKTSFKMAFDLWHEITSQILKNPLNDCGHKLCNEIMDFYATL